MAAIGQGDRIVLVVETVEPDDRFRVADVDGEQHVLSS